MLDKKYLISPEYPQGILVDLTAEEIAQREQDAIKAQADKAARESKEAEIQANKQSALNKLSALGLTEAEIKSIIGN
jgi:DNA-binding transcriptional regulator YhcF (GntR family)